MKTILVFVPTLDGKVTKWCDPFVSSWLSEEDLHYFNKLWNDTSLIVMGSNTYNVDPMKQTSNHYLNCPVTM